MKLTKRGVTLVELLAVLVIMGIIAAISIPTIGNLIQNQEDKAAVISGNSVLDSLRLYALDNPGSMPAQFDFATDAVAAQGQLETALNGYITTFPTFTGDLVIDVADNGNVTITAEGTTDDVTIDGVAVDASNNLFILDATP